MPTAITAADKLEAVQPPFAIKISEKLGILQPDRLSATLAAHIFQDEGDALNGI